MRLHNRIYIVLCVVWLAWASQSPSSAEESSSSSNSSSEASSSSQSASIKMDCVRAGKLLADGVKLGDGSKAEEALYRQAMQLCPDMAEVYHNLGVNLYRQSMIPEAVQQLEKAVELKDDVSIRLSLGLARMAAGSLDLAAEDFNKTLEKSPDNIRALQGLAIIYERQGKNQDAVTILNRAKTAEPSNSLTLYNLGVLYSRIGDVDSAIKNWSAALSADPGNFQLAFLLGQAYLQTGKLMEAESALKKANSLKSDKTEVYSLLAQLYQKQNDLDKAELSLKKALALDDKNAGAWTNLGIVQLEKRQEAKAIESAEQALKIDSTSVQALMVRGWAEIGLGKLNDAEMTFKKVMDSDASNAPAHYALGVVYERKGERDDAAREYQDAERLDPSQGYKKNRVSAGAR